MKAVYTQKRGKKIRGVNLGGWLVLEKWMTPSLFAGIQGEDETAWCLAKGAVAEKQLQEHWQTFIQRHDFAWLAKIGINAVRIPIPYWLFGPDYPYHPSFGDTRYPYVTGGLSILDKAFDWAEELGLLIVLDLHTAPGCQNGFDNGGLKDICEWHTQQNYQDYALTVLERLAERYQHRPALQGIEVLNEPRWDIPTDILLAYTQAAYQRIRQYCTAEQVAVVFHDGFRPYHEYNPLLAANYDNLVFDIHRYQCFVQEDVDTDVHGHLIKAAQDWRLEADDIISHANCWTYVGEWSLGLNPKMLDLWQQAPQQPKASSMDAFQQALTYRAYAAAQLLSFEKYLGWFFWSYKTENMLHWSFRDCVASGWLPERFD
ncbi:glycoside hydrolase family 5 protein [Methylomonas sp. AM2-LC]|uniref:glycoside hydrolase family 5 protein n=1 Tax=Methylomonas sp. AM2-LC TaxID=3153301 RepID=UPI003263C171